MSYPAIIACIVFGLFFIYNYFKTNEVNRMIEKWPTTQGKILEKNYTPQGPRSAPQVTVQYEFVVDGKRYQSDRIYLKHWQFFINDKKDYDKMDNLEFIKNPIVKYNPTDPQSCCLLLYPNSWIYTFLLILGIILTVIGGLGLIFRLTK
jgi:hypothetical protein